MLNSHPSYRISGVTFESSHTLDLEGKASNFFDGVVHEVEIECEVKEC